MDSSDFNTRSRDDVYSICASAWFKFGMWLSIGEVRRSLDEFWQDWLLKQPPGYIFNPSCEDCELVLCLVEEEPLRWCYNRPDPDKGTWSETAHLVRLLVRWQVLHRFLTQIDPGPLDSRTRMTFVREDLALITVWAKLNLSAPDTVRHLGEARLSRFNR
ncbi:hypothetical protein ACHAPT_002366 [Fusarium lateritium]